MAETDQQVVRILYRCTKCNQAIRVDYRTMVGERESRYFLLAGGEVSYWIPTRDCPRCGRMMSRAPIAATLKTTVRCSPACVNAVGDTCVCSCGGGNHGAAYLIIETEKTLRKEL